MLTLTARQQQNVGILAVVGRIDPTTVTAVVFMSSLGLRALMTTLVSVRARQGALVICGLNENLTLLFRTAGFLTLFTVTATEADALAAIAA